MFTILLLTTQSSLFAMELVPLPPSNSSSEMCFLINNITPQYSVPEDTKKELLTLYIAVTNDERKQAGKCTFIESSDYMNLNKENKLYITNCWYSDTIKIEEKTIVFDSHDAPQHYAQMLKLPQHIRRQIAKKYSSIVLAKKTGPKEWMDKKQAINQVAMKGLMLTIASIFIVTIVAGTIIYNDCNNSVDPSTIVIPMVFFHTLGASYIIRYYPETTLNLYHHNGYELLPLLPEGDTK